MIELLSIVVMLAGAGPVSKFDARTPVADYDSSAKLEDIERCMIDISGQLAPATYRQPDRPDQVMILWPKAGDAAGITAFRVDLVRTVSGTHVRSWMPAKQALDCAPR